MWAAQWVEKEPIKPRVLKFVSVRHSCVRFPRRGNNWITEVGVRILIVVAGIVVVSSSSVGLVVVDIVADIQY